MRVRKEICEKHLGYKIVKKLSKGDSFGDISIIMNVKRTATVCALKDCDLIVLS